MRFGQRDVCDESETTDDRGPGSDELRLHRDDWRLPVRSGSSELRAADCYLHFPGNFTDSHLHDRSGDDV